MLANGTTLGYRKHTGGEASGAYTDLPGLKEIPEVGTEIEKVGLAARWWLGDARAAGALRVSSLGLGTPIKRISL